VIWSLEIPSPSSIDDLFLGHPFAGERRWPETKAPILKKVKQSRLRQAEHLASKLRHPFKVELIFVSEKFVQTFLLLCNSAELNNSWES
jgi:hypothetical protein